MKAVDLRTIDGESSCDVVKREDPITNLACIVELK
jgi:hypothetical protein